MQDVSSWPGTDGQLAQSPTLCSLTQTEICRPRHRAVGGWEGDKNIFIAVFSF